MTENTNLDNAQELLDSRLAVYGERVKNMEDVAKVFSGILGHEVRADQVPLLMIGYKTVRASGTPDYGDNIKDIEGYALMFREIIGEDMIEAVNTDEYLEKKAAYRAVNPPVQSVPHPLEQAAREELAKRERAYNSTLEDEIDEAAVAELTDLIERSYDQHNSFVYGHRAAAAVAAEEAERFFAARRGKA